MSHQAYTNPSLSSALIEMAALLSDFLLKIEQVMISATEYAERQHRRAHLLAAYRRRRSWKASDIGPLNSLSPSASARKRMQRLTGKSRPVVTAHQPLAYVLATKISAFQSLVHPAASPLARRKAFRHWPWWRHHVEALYRGEHALARDQGIAGSSDHAERLVGAALGMSAPSVRASAAKFAGCPKSTRRQPTSRR